ncbi:MAG: hypothetical protein WCP26_07085 [Actinomycetes bacterium]
MSVKSPLIVSLALAAALAGCSSQSTDSNTGSPTPSGPSASATASASENGIREQSAPDIVKTASTNATAATSVHLQGDGTCPSGKFHADLALSNDGLGQGEVKFSPYTLKMVSTPKTLYLQAEPAFWATMTTDADAAKVGSKWVAVPASGNPCLAALGSLQSVVAAYLTFTGIPVKEKSLSVHGVPAQLVSISPDITLWVSAVGTPLPVQMSEVSSQTKMLFSEWSKPVVITVPKSSDTIDASTLAKKP